MRAKIIGTGSYVPSKSIANADLERLIDTSDEWIQERTGIKTRHVASSGEGSSSLGIKAARSALESSGLIAEDLDLIIVATCTPDMPFPSTACLIQAALGASKAAAFDVSAACSGFLFILSIT